MDNASRHNGIEKKMSTHEKGMLGEDKATAYLLANGYEVVDRNFRQRNGEIDIIATKDSYLVFVEVKSLPHGNIETLAAELNRTKQEKILKIAKCYLQKHRQYNCGWYIRFDVLAIDVPGLEPVHHITNAFSE